MKDDTEELVSLSIDDEHLNRLNEVVKDLETVGLAIEMVLKTGGVVAGRIERGKIADLANVRGVSTVEGPRLIELPPPRSKLQ